MKWRIDQTGQIQNTDRLTKKSSGGLYMSPSFLRCLTSLKPSKPKPRLKWLDSLKKALTFGLSLTAIQILCLSSPLAQAEQIPAQTAYKCLCGEACNQGIVGMIAVGEVLRNRGGIQGVYGCKTDLYEKSPEYVKRQVKEAWEKSESSNITGRSTHFENVKAFGDPSWAKSMNRTVKIKDHQFYKEAVTK